MSEKAVLPDATRMGPVELAVRDLETQVRFYRDLLGMRVHSHAARDATLGAPDEVLLKLRAEPDAASRPHGSAGLYHVAYLVPTRADLGRAIEHLVRARYPLQGASDHEFSEALYLADPEGNGIEIYADRPRSAWPAFKDLTFARMGPQPMDVEGVLAEGRAAGSAWQGYPDGTRVGHVHLNVADVAKADAFYRGSIGFEPVIDLGSASFVSAGGYHHHVAVNNWGMRGEPNTNETLGLRGLTIVVPGEGYEDAVKRVGGEAVADPSGNRVRLVKAG